MSRDLHRTLTDAILAQIEAGPGLWSCPWHRSGGGLPTNVLTRKTYHGINIVSLWMAEQAHGFASSRWASYRQWKSLGAQVRKGEKGTPVLFYRDHPRPDDADEEAPRFVARSSFVFNLAQVDGAIELEISPATIVDPMPTLDRFVEATGALIREGESAAYLPRLDEISMPARERFRSAEGYAATLAHELVHWTGHPSRLDRQLTTRFASQAYAAEELVAELGSAFTLAYLGLACAPHPNHASYIAHWLPLLRADPRALVAAAGHASRAADHLAGLQPGSRAGSPLQTDEPGVTQGVAV